MAMDPKHLEQATAYGFRRLPVRWPAGQSDQRHRPALARPLAGEQNGILTHRAEIWREPVADVDKPLRLHRVMVSDKKSAPGDHETARMLTGFDAAADTRSASPSLRALRINWPLIQA